MKPILIVCGLLVAGPSLAAGQTPEPSTTPAEASKVTCEEKNPTPTGGVEFKSDAKGVDMGPWVGRFAAQVRRNWFVPYKARSTKGCATISIRIHKDGTAEEPVVENPSLTQEFTRSAYNALRLSFPMEPLPEQYPNESVLFTTTFFYQGVPEPPDSAVPPPAPVTPAETPTPTEPTK